MCVFGRRVAFRFAVFSGLGFGLGLGFDLVRVRHARLELFQSRSLDSH